MGIIVMGRLGTLIIGMSLLGAMSTPVYAQANADTQTMAKLENAAVKRKVVRVVKKPTPQRVSLTSDKTVIFHQDAKTPAKVIKPRSQKGQMPNLFID